jgi:nucleoside-diphosphate-sugar epimerase
LSSVLITGAGGLIGRRVAETMRQARYGVRTLIRKAGENNTTGTIVHDLRLPLTNVPPADWVFHLAGAYAGAGEDELQRADLAMAKNLIRWGISAGVKNWIFASAAEVYGDVEGFATENSPTAPVIPYGRIKLQIEKLFTHELSAISNCRLVILRIGEVYGSGSKLLAELTARLRRGFCPWPGSGAVPLSFVHAEDVAAAFLCVAQNATSGATIYNVADDAQATWRDFIMCVARLCGTRRPQFLPMGLVKLYASASTLGCRLVGQEPVLTPHALRLITTPKLLSNAQAKHDLGFQPQYATYSEGLEEALGLSHHTQDGAAQASASR